ncbi:MAG TPA: ATP-binding protein [Fibrobacteria bacterium]|nr:ATP-binding protein [Fibrobacteria bacterium]
MISFRDRAELAAVQNKVVDVTHLVSLFFASLAMIPGFLRSKALGNYQATWVAVVFVILSLVLYYLRRRIPVWIRAVYMVGAFAGYGAYVLYEAGIVAAAGFFVPTSVMLAWLLWRPAYAWTVTAVAFLVFALAAIKNVRHGGAFESQMAVYNRLPETWINMFGIYLMTGAVILVTTRVLLGSVRANLERVGKSEADAKSERERLGGILQGVHDAIFLLDPESGRVLEVFGRFEGMYGFRKEELEGGDMERISAGITPWTAAEAKLWIGKSLKEGQKTFSWRARRRNGELFWVEISIMPITLQGQGRMLVTIRDIDSSMRTQLELANLNADLERRVLLRTMEIERSRAAMETFSYTVSHDLRAPLRAIDGFARVLEEDHKEALPEEGKVALERIVAGAGRMSRLIDALLSLSRLDRRKIDSIPVDVAKLVQEVRDELMADPCHAQRGIEWVLGELPAIRSDADFLRQVFANLMGNACKFTRGVPDPRISIRTIERDDGIWFEVADNGIGFDMAQSGKLFQVFQRLHGESVDGLGIGLATVKKIVDRMEGAIEAEGAPGEGATFRFRLEPAKTESVQAG